MIFEARSRLHHSGEEGHVESPTPIACDSPSTRRARTQPSSRLGGTVRVPSARTTHFTGDEGDPEVSATMDPTDEGIRVNAVGPGFITTPC